MLKLHIHIKFRAFGRDLAVHDEKVKLPDDVQAALAAANVGPKTLYDAHGVKVDLVADEAAPTA